MDAAASVPAAICCCFSSSLPFPPPCPTRTGVCERVYQMHFSGSAAPTVSVTIRTTPGSYYYAK